MNSYGKAVPLTATLPILYAADRGIAADGEDCFPLSDQMGHTAGKPHDLQISQESGRYEYGKQEDSAGGSL